MTTLAEQFYRRRHAQPAPTAAPSVGEIATRDPGISPQDFYQELVERPDVQRILTRLAQIKDGGA